jgi:hypothetical protein
MLYVNNHSKPTIIKTLWYWHEGSHIAQWTRIDMTEINSHINVQMIFDKGVKITQWKIIFLTKNVGKDT